MHFVPVNGRLLFEVPLDKADAIRDRLADAGIPATVHLDPDVRADIEVPADADPQALAAAGLGQ